MNQVKMKLRDLQMGKSAGNAAETSADGFYRNFEYHHHGGSQEQSKYRARNANGNGAANKDDQHGCSGKRHCRVRKSMEATCQGLHAHRENAPKFTQRQAEETPHPRAGDQASDAAGEADHDRTRNGLTRRSHPNSPPTD